jgi:hypothetical protein
VTSRAAARSFLRGNSALREDHGGAHAQARSDAHTIDRHPQ